MVYFNKTIFCLFFCLSSFTRILGSENDSIGTIRAFNKDSSSATNKYILAIAFTGGFLGKGKPLFEISDYAGTTGKVVNSCRRFASFKEKSFDGLVIGSGVSSKKSVKNALKFIHKYDNNIASIVIYGYSWGGDFAIELSKKLQKERKKVDILFTLDATDGPLQNFTVDKKIPENVAVNYNFYQTENLGTSSGSDFIFKKGSGSNSSSFDSPNSHGRANVVINPTKTKVVNFNLTGIDGIFHSNIDEKVFKDVLRRASILDVLED
jgi:hypothetical protein